jgi:hypothetical protein
MNRFRIDCDEDLVADNNATPFEGAVPTDAKVVTVYLGRGQEARPGLGTLVDSILPPGRLPLPPVVEVQSDLRHAIACPEGRPRLLERLIKPGPPLDLVGVSRR